MKRTIVTRTRPDVSCADDFYTSGVYTYIAEGIGVEGVLSALARRMGTGGSGGSKCRGCFFLLKWRARNLRNGSGSVLKGERCRCVALDDHFRGAPARYY